MAERSKASVLGTDLFGGVSSNLTSITLIFLRNTKKKKKKKKKMERWSE